MTKILTSSFFATALALAVLTGTGSEALAQKNTQRSWTGKQPNFQLAAGNGSHAKINALISKPGNSQDFVANGSGSWHHHNNSTYTYNAQGQLTQRLYTDPATNQNIGREMITYDAKGNEAEYRAEGWNGTAWELADGYKSQTTYNANGYKTEVIFEDWDSANSLWIKIGREETAYDANNLVTSITYSGWTGSTWVFEDRMVLSNVGGAGTSAVMQEYNNGVWEDVLRALNLTWHVPYEIPSAYILEEFDNNSWSKVEKYASVYDANGGHVGIYEFWNGITWEKYLRETETFDNNKNYTGWKEESWSQTTNTWNYEGEDRQLLTYSGIDITQRIFQNSWGSPTGTLADQNKEVYSNFQTFNVSGVKNQLAESAVNVFPNPVSDILRIETSEIKGSFTATLADVTAKTWLNKTFKAGEETTLNLETLPAGVYMLQLQTETGSAVKRIVKQ